MIEREPPRYGGDTDGWLTNRLRLPTARWMQAWPLEVSDGSRLREFCDLYDAGTPDRDTQFVLMELIISSLDDVIDDASDETREMADRIEKLLDRDFMLHFHTVNYWRVPDPKWEDGFSVTPMMRRIWARNFKPEYRRRLGD